MAMAENDGKHWLPSGKMAGQWRAARKPPAPAYEWPRYDRYEIRDGCILGAPEAKLCFYNPWAAYQEGRLKNRVQPPYQYLLEVAAKVDPAGMDLQDGAFS